MTDMRKRLAVKAKFKGGGRPMNPTAKYTHVAFRHEEIARLARVATTLQAAQGFPCSPRQAVLFLLHHWEQEHPQ